MRKSALTVPWESISVMGIPCHWGKLLIHQLGHCRKGDRQLVGMHLHTWSITPLDSDGKCFPVAPEPREHGHHARAVVVREPVLSGWGRPPDANGGLSVHIGDHRSRIPAWERKDFPAASESRRLEASVGVRPMGEQHVPRAE
jgi:hypothetical protein